MAGNRCRESRTPPSVSFAMRVVPTRTTWKVKKKNKKKRNIKARPAPRRWGRGSRNISDNPPSHSPGRFARRRSPQKRKEQHFVRVARPLASFFTSSTFATVFFLFSPPGGSKRAQTEKLIKRSCLGLPFKCTDKRTLTVIFC